jgi:hypothetical protein
MQVNKPVKIIIVHKSAMTSRGDTPRHVPDGGMLGKKEFFYLLELASGKKMYSRAFFGFFWLFIIVSSNLRDMNNV